MSPRRERVFTFLTLAGLTAAFLGVVTLPGHRAAAELRTEIAASEAEIARGPQALKLLGAAQQEFMHRQAYLAESSGVVAEPHELLETINRIAIESGLTVVRIEPEEICPQASYVEHPFRLELRGTLGALTDFLRGLEQSPRLYAIDELLLRRPTGNSVSGAGLEGTLRFTVFAARAGSETLAEENGSNGPS